MTVSVANYGALKTRVESNTGRGGTKFNELFPQWLNETIRDIEQIYPLSYTYDPDTRVALDAQSVLVERLITQHPFVVKTFNRSGTLTTPLTKVDKLLQDPTQYETIDYGVPTHFSVHYDQENPENVKLRVYPPSDDATREIVVAGYFYTTRTTWETQHSNYLIARYPKLIRYGITKLLYEFEKDYGQADRNDREYEKHLYGRPDAETEGLIQQEKRANERGIVRTVRVPTDFVEREGPTGPRYYNDQYFGDEYYRRIYGQDSC